MNDSTEQTRAAGGPPVTGDQLRATLAGLIGISPDEIEDDANLIHLGLQSLQVMRLATRWRRAGLEVSFGDLAADPTFAAWNDRITRELAKTSA
ncbi:phosphopantetheine-binding protein [Streptomyces alkaliterrae]|uniref:Isochorismatase n=1 Tax=Streptomyces alkaliterrae TaxID=2213162 RepID=A0A5P0YXL6_9ACTN|nr:phosphopantetheine-binding protein [Streptomyces alkaliterrae]MBB1252316.1 isochorismatase [Streptomyces alkaliterrae]MBB1258117.1 isochorismatase [Streptomyces alkaliterrae]MQS04252.1 isochorismatase [Streptomyces alkaliterrae]